MISSTRSFTSGAGKYLIKANTKSQGKYLYKIVIFLSVLGGAVFPYSGSAFLEIAGSGSCAMTVIRTGATAAKMMALVAVWIIGG